MTRKIILATLLLVVGLSMTAYAGGDMGYKKGFYIKTDDGKFLLNIGAVTQFRWSYYSPDLFDDTSEFKIPLLRPMLFGHIWDPNLQFKFVWETRDELELKDGYFDYVAYKFASIRGGQYYVPFNREQLTEPFDLQFVDYSIVNDYFTYDRDLGIEFHKQFAGDKFEYAFGIFNGNGPNTWENDNNKYMYAFRFGVYPNGYVKYVQSSLEDPDDLIWGFGAALNYNTYTEWQNESPFDTEAFSATGDITLRYRGLSFETAYIFRNIEPKDIDMANFDSTGFVVQAGYLFVPEKFEIALRFAVVDPNKDIEDWRNKEFTAGWNYYFRMHYLKFQMDYSRLLTEEPGISDVKDDRIRAQFQYRF